MTDIAYNLHCLNNKTTAGLADLFDSVGGGGTLHLQTIPNNKQDTDN